jgi:hypothetical protein
MARAATVEVAVSSKLVDHLVSAAIVLLTIGLGTTLTWNEFWRLLPIGKAVIVVGMILCFGAAWAGDQGDNRRSGKPSGRA